MNGLPASNEINDLLRELHDATERLGQSRREVEKWMEASEYRHQERVDAAEAQFREAEKEVEKIDTKIRRAMGGSSH